jgi:hypothetical protein
VRQALLLTSTLVFACSAASGRRDASPSGDAGPRLDAASGSEADASLAPDAGSDAGADDSGYAMTCTGTSAARPYSKYKWPFYGDLHLHTSHSLDAYDFGNRSRPLDAYLFAQKEIAIAIGQATDVVPGPTVTIDRPLDFLAVTDHSEWLGIAQGCVDPQSGFYDRPGCVLVRSTRSQDQLAAFHAIGTLHQNLCESASAAECAAEARTAWEDEQMAAAIADQPCRFTSFVAYEWTSPYNVSGHRNVIFGTSAVPSAPLDSASYPTASALWTGLEAECTEAGGCRAITIPHNTNLSQGRQFALTSSADAPLMEKYQTLVEIYQHKGSSECYYDPQTTTDVRCGFEYVAAGDDKVLPDQPKAYVRSALEDGLRFSLEQPAPLNPLKLGFAGATDDHNAAPGHVKETDYTGHAGWLDDDASRRLQNAGQNGSGGLTVAWAEQNTRDAIFAAFRRRETYATSGPRITVRFYMTHSSSPCTADFPGTIIDAGDALPMGGTFRASDVGAGAAPQFVIGAWPDPEPQVLQDDSTRMAPLESVQVIKAHGKNDASGHAQIVEDPPITLPIDGAGQCLVWTDPSFDPTEQAFYYVRVLQVLTWRWSHFDCMNAPSANPTACAPGGALNVAERERAWTSPIWYEP